VLAVIKGWPALARRGADDRRILFQIAAGVAPSGRRVGVERRGKWKQLGIAYGGDDCRLLLDVPNGRGDLIEFAGAELAALVRQAFEIPLPLDQRPRRREADSAACARAYVLPGEMASLCVLAEQDRANLISEFRREAMPSGRFFKRGG
jgi:hypothetical protein